MDLPNSSQVAAAGRHVLTFAMGGVSFLATVNILSPSDATTVTASVTQISHGVAEIAAGLAPLVAMASGFYSVWTASHKSQIAAVNNAIPGVKVVRDTAPAPVVTEPPPVPKAI